MKQKEQEALEFIPLKKKTKYNQLLVLLLSVFALTAVFVVSGQNRKWQEKAVEASATGDHTVGDRQIPIYCVDTEKPQVAISFDAAWGNGRLMEDSIAAMMRKCRYR